MGGRRLRGGIATAFVLAASWAVGACDITAPLPADAERFAPPAIYRRWWAMTEACSGRTGNFASVRWYSVPGDEVDDGGKPATAYWQQSANRVVITVPNVDNGAVVRHEMLHALIRAPGHPRSQFLGRCASVVRFGESVPNEGWFHPPSGYLLLPTESLQVAAQAQLLPREADGQRWLAVHVSATNPRSVPVLAEVRGGPAVYQTFTMNGPISWSVDEADSSKFYFKPGETKEWLFESRVTSDVTQYHITPGTKVLQGGYGHARAPWDTVVVSP